MKTDQNDCLVGLREWFAVRVKPRQEEIARLHFLRQGFTVYLPQTVKTVRHARREKEVLRPFFSGYLFLYLAPEERNWTAIGSTIGAIGPVCFGNQYPAVPDWMIEELKGREDADGRISTLEYDRAFLKPGSKVKVGPEDYEGLDGVFKEMRGQDRAVVLLEMLSRQVAAIVPLAALSAV